MMPSHVKRVLRGAVGATVVTVVANAVYQALGERADRRRYPPPGRVVRLVNGQRLHVWCEGEGDVTAVMIPALGGSCLTWTSLQRELATSIRVCVYDRAGLGWSDSAPGWRRTIGDQADELHEMLLAGDIAGPVVLVGSSTGGVVARLVAARYPEQVAGIVLVDSSHERQMERFAQVYGWPERGFRYWKRAVELQLRPYGLMRLGRRFGLVFEDSAVPRGVIPELVDAYRAFELSSKIRRADVKELVGLRKGFAQARAQRCRLDRFPVVVLSRAPEETAFSRARGQTKEAWVELQEDLASLSVQASHIVVDQAGHFIHLDRPDVVAKTVLDMCAAVTQESG